MDVTSVLESGGIRRSDIRVATIAIIFAVVAVTAYGGLAPVVSEPHTLESVLESDRAVLPALAAVLAVLVGGGMFGTVFGIRLVERRWLWPLGPRIARPRRSRLFYLPMVLPALWLPVCAYVVRPLLPSASALYLVSEEPLAWLRVVAPADFAYAFVVALLGWVITFSIGVLVVGAWRSFSHRMRSARATADAREN